MYIFLCVHFFFKFPVQCHSYFLTFYMCVVNCLARLFCTRRNIEIYLKVPRLVIHVCSRVNAMLGLSRLICHELELSERSCEALKERLQKA